MFIYYLIIKILMDNLLALDFNSTSIPTEEYLNNFTKGINNIINHKLEAGTMTEADAKILRKMLIRIRTDTNLLNAVKGFTSAFNTLDLNWTIGTTSVLNDNMDSSLKLANLLALVMNE